MSKRSFRGLIFVLLAQSLFICEGRAFSLDSLLDAVKFRPGSLTMNTLRDFLKEVAPVDTKIYIEKLTRIKNQCTFLETRFQEKNSAQSRGSAGVSTRIYTRAEYIEKFSKQDYQNVLKMVKQLEFRASRLNDEIEGFLKAKKHEKSNGLDLKEIISNLPKDKSVFIRLAYAELVTKSGWPDFTFSILMSTSSGLLEAKLNPAIQELKKDVTDRKFDQCQFKITEFLGEQE